MKRNVNPSGVALVVVLAFLVLLSALIVSFFSSVTTEYSTAKSFSDGLSPRPPLRKTQRGPLSQA